MVTYRELLKTKSAELASSGIENAEYDCAEILGMASGKDCRSNDFRMMLDEECDDAVADGFAQLCARRSSGEPLQYILGEWEFCGMKMFVGEGVLIPRQDTETLVETVLNKYKKQDSTIIDLCAGSGCIGLALEKLMGCEELYAVEKSEDAAAYLKRNAELHGSKLRLVMGDVLDTATLDKLPMADLIVCNPPYLTSRDMERLQLEVTHEPEAALFGGEDGLDFYRTVTRLWKNKLNDGGMLIYEIGAGQEDEVMQILVQHGFKNVRCKPDACGIIRNVFAIHNSP